uniref:DDE Tnp4 domain-containing protein n=1 Tax=Astyanax mexicanus TaxID=7994 RepID=A0A3B1ILG9_ASTMX
CRRTAVLQGERPHGSLTSYCQLNTAVPILQLYFGGADLRADLRLSRETITSLTAALRQETDHGWSRDIEVLVFLYWLAHAASYRVVSRVFAIPKSSVHDIVHRVSKDVSGIIKRVITLPTGDDLEVIGAGFAHLAPAFTVAVGAIDGCHIRIKPPSANAQCYLNRKLFHSVQLQAICDHQGKFLDIFVGYPGSVHDARILKNSPLYKEALYPPAGRCILGDGGYPCISTPIKLLTPYREPVQNPVQARFNRKLSHVAQCSTTCALLMVTSLSQMFQRRRMLMPQSLHKQRKDQETRHGRTWLQLSLHPRWPYQLFLSVIIFRVLYIVFDNLQFY